MRPAATVRVVELFLVESYRSKVEPESLAASTERARSAAEELAREGTPVRYVRSIFLRDDEICFYLYEAASAAVAAEAASRSGLTFERVVAAVTERPPRRRNAPPLQLRDGG